MRDSTSFAACKPTQLPSRSGSIELSDALFNRCCSRQTVVIAIDRSCGAQTVGIAIDKYCDAQADRIAVDERKH